MPILNCIADLVPDMLEWRHHLQSIPELGFDLHKTSAHVADKLHEGIAKTGAIFSKHI